jgi:hypothetical protein
MGAVFFLGIYAIIDDVIAILFSSDLVVSRNISFVITLNGFVQFMRQTVLMFRDATGTFYHDRWKPLAEGLFNVVFSILFVKWIGIAGVILATIATNLLICHVIEPYVLYKNAFSQSPARYYCKNYSWILLFAAALVLVNSCMVEISSRWQQLITNGFISVVISIVICTVTIILNKETFSYMIQMMRKK